MEGNELRVVLVELRRTGRDDSGKSEGQGGNGISGPRRTVAGIKPILRQTTKQI